MSTQATQIIATIYWIEGDKIEKEDMSFETEAKFRKWAKEELQWESTHRITCNALNYDEKGFYLSYHR